MNTPVTELAGKLDAGSYGILFYWPQHETTTDRIWSEPGNPALLESVLEEPSASAKAKFIAAEVLFRNEFTFVERHDRVRIARLFAEALRRRYTGHANAWGLLWIDDSAGEIGGRFMALGKDSIPALRELLADTTVVDWYEGSEEATLGNRARYRIKDFAAFYLARVLGTAIPFHEDFAGRDAEIAKLVAIADTRR